jgi:alpha-amylase/alpha-mannosidase (GH57 family)
VTKIERSALVVHGHFSQPARGNPITYTIGEEADAAPFRNWNERIHENCYKPNATIGNFNYISFSASEGLMKWLESDAPDSYKLIVEADQQAYEKFAPAGNAIATAYNHIIMPLARKRDKRTQAIWGLAVFEKHYGRKAAGFWMPEVAVDLETLGLLAEAGVEYTVVTERQVRNLPPGGGAGPYRVELPGGRQIGVFVRHDALSSELSFNVHNLGGAGSWARQALATARKNSGPVLLLATAGETFGHHFAGEEQFLHWLVTHEAQQAGFEITTLDRIWQSRKPTQSVTIAERTSWGDYPGLTQWATGVVEHGKDTTWKGALRRALDNATSDLDKVYEDALRPYSVDPWRLRDDYLPALLKGHTPDEFISERIPSISSKAADVVKVSLQAQRLIQRMYNSYTFTDNVLDGRQPRYAIACAAAALSMVQDVTGLDLNDRLPLDLAVVTSPDSAVTGGDMLRESLQMFDLTLLAGR